jgi:toxin ParE1/3/4
MNLRIHPAAEEETRKAALWYERQRSGLGAEFLAAIDTAIQQLQEAPLRFSRLETLPNEDTVRRRLVKRFPYAVIYELLANEIEILAVAHTRRRPGYWKRRRSRD